MRDKAIDGVAYMRSDRGLNMLKHCLEWGKFLLRIKQSKSKVGLYYNAL